MRLRLVLKGPERLMGAETEKVVENGSIVIGRSPAADWTIPDPQRILSKAHCRVDNDLDAFVLTDTSTNGVRVNDEMIGFGLPRQLADGDVILLGDAVLVASIAASASPVPGNGVEAAAAPVMQDGPFGMEGAAYAASGATRPGEGAALSKQVIGDAILDDWWKPDSDSTPVAAPKAMDISVNENHVPIADTIVSRDVLPSNARGGLSLGDAVEDLDLKALVRAVEAASLALPEAERQAFDDRLREALRKEGSSRA